MILELVGKGRCVFADKVYKKGDIIEVCHYILIPHDQIPALKGTIINHYRFGTDGAKGDAMILLGNGSLYNHSKNPNMIACMDCIKQVGFEAKKDIKIGEELVFDYGYEIECKPIGNLFIQNKAKGPTTTS